MTAPTPLSVQLRQNTVAEFADLIHDIAREGDTGQPYLAPALLFAAPETQTAIGMPIADKTTILVHEYQAIHRMADIPLDRQLTTSMRRKQSGDLSEFSFTLGTSSQDIAKLDTALRLIPRMDFSGIKPKQFPDAENLGTVALRKALVVTQDQVDRYQALSGDMNPIHHDVKMVRPLGLKAPIVPGLLLISTVQPLLDAARPDLSLSSLKSRFMAPLCVGQEFTIAVQDRGQTPDGSTRIRAYFMTEKAQALAVADMVFQPEPRRGG